MDRVWVSDDRATLAWWHPHDAAARALGAIVSRTPRPALDRMAAGVVHQGVIARATEARIEELDDVVGSARGAPLFVLLDGVEDPRNLGAIVRSAAAAGADGVLLPERRVAALGPGAAKASAGALGRVRLARVKNVQRALERLAESGIWTVGLAAGAPPLWQADLARATCFVVGGEGKGLSRLARERCDEVRGIPLASGVESLNASVAASIALFEAVRQRSLA